MPRKLSRSGLLRKLRRQTAALRSAEQTLFWSSGHMDIPADVRFRLLAAWESLSKLLKREGEPPT